MWVFILFLIKKRPFSELNPLRNILMVLYTLQGSILHITFKFDHKAFANFRAILGKLFETNATGYVERVEGKAH